MKLYCRQIGKGEPLIILHGLFGTSDNWLTIGKQLAKNFHLYILDMRNHGRSAHHDLFNYDVMVEDVYEFLTDFNLRRVSLLGHSMGGMIAMRFALEYPHRVQQMVVVDIAPRSYPVVHRKIVDGLQAISLENLSTRHEADRILSDYIEDTHVRQFLLKNLRLDHHKKYQWRINLPVIAKNLALVGEWKESAATYDGPVRFIRGGAADYITENDEDIIKSRFPNAVISTIPGASHWVHVDAPDAFITMLNEFLSHNSG